MITFFIISSSLDLLYLLYHILEALSSLFFNNNINFTFGAIQNILHGIFDPSGINAANKVKLKGFPFLNVDEVKQGTIPVEVVAESTTDGVIIRGIHNGDGVLHCFTSFLFPCCDYIIAYPTGFVNRFIC